MKRIESLIDSLKLNLSLSITNSQGEELLSFNKDKKCVLQSVYKFHIAIVALYHIQLGKLKLNTKIEITKDNLNTDLYSVIKQTYPGGIVLTLSELILYSVTMSDNIACDKILELIDGPSTVNKFFSDRGYEGINIIHNEDFQQSSWDRQFDNWITPKTSNIILKDFYDCKLISKDNSDFLLNCMINSETGANRIRGKLLKGTMVADKTGTSGKNQSGMMSAINDIGIIFSPKGEPLFLSIFVSDSYEDIKISENLIAEVSKLAYDSFLMSK